MQAAASVGNALNDPNGGSSSELFFRDANGNRIDFAPSPPGAAEYPMGFEHEIV